MKALEIVREFLAAENRRDWERWASFLHPDVRYVGVPSGREVVGKARYVGYMQRAYEEIPDWEFRVVHLVGGGESVIGEFEGRGHFTGVHGGKQYERVSLRLRAVCVFELESGLIREVREYFDAVGYQRQIEAAPSGDPEAKGCS